MSTSAITPGLTPLQTLAGDSPSLATRAVQAALQNASPQDVVALSEAAVQAQTVAGLFGTSGSSSGAAFDPASILKNLVESVTQNSPGSSASPNAPVAPLQSLLEALQGQQVAALFGTTPGTGLYG